MIKYILIIFFAFVSQITSAHVLIFTYACNHPEYIEWQAKTLALFADDEYELIVFNNAFDGKERAAINAMCESLNIKVIQVPYEIHQKGLYIPEDSIFGNASVYHCRAAQWSLEHYGLQHDDILVIFDGDLFLIQPFSFRKFLDNYQIAGFYKYGGIPSIPYLWLGLIMLDLRQLPNKETLNICCVQVTGGHLDSGGGTYHYLENNKVRLRTINQQHINSLRCTSCQKKLFGCCAHNFWKLRDMNMGEDLINLIEYMPLLPLFNIEFYHDYTFMHYQGGSDYHTFTHEQGINAWQAKRQAVKQFINNLIN